MSNVTLFGELGGYIGLPIVVTCLAAHYCPLMVCENRALLTTAITLKQSRSLHFPSVLAWNKVRVFKRLDCFSDSLGLLCICSLRGILLLNPLVFTSPQIENLPPELFQCKKLRTLNLGNNALQSLPSRVGELTNLAQMELRGNRLECLPVELGECHLLKRSGLVVEEDLFITLPLEVKEKLTRADKEPVWGRHVGSC